MSRSRSKKPEHKTHYNTIYTRENLIYLISAFILTILLWWNFKKNYPHPNVIFDSYYYLNATASNAVVNAWPIGYSWFVRLIGTISHSPTFFVTIQYFLLNCSLLIYFFTLKYLFNPPKWVSIVFFAFLIFNPILLYTSNLILSDTLFTTLSILWITNIIWLFISPKYWFLITHSLLILTVFTVRYNALYYPILSTIAFLFLKRELFYKLTGIVLQYTLLIAFILFTIQKNESTFKVKQFSAFGGWKLANDALYMYKHIYRNNEYAVPQRLKPLDVHVRSYFKREKDTIDLFTPDPTSGSYYMYIHPSPLLTYRDSVSGKVGSPLDLDTFSKMAPLYQDYGFWLIIKNPIAFFQYFIWPNIQRYFISPPEVYTDNENPFTIRTDSLGMAARKWFNLKTISSKQSTIDLRYTIFMNYPILNIIIHFMFTLTFISLAATTGLKNMSSRHRKVIIIIGLLWIFDFGFNILAAAVVLRYQIFISIIEFSFAIIFLEKITQNNLQPNIHEDV
ncbi:hypothetical protein [Chitinophaga silvisoli]|uniref:Glycosyltransferase RgtA/B/C/D-like domain-containing protein n=1 Tax=Chitinophaga silvisoli TaxID=2291814 RepID=A0A3E1P3D9_9BACT|nr:hypothetical protein [Chitinophaga silvisoli]RFM34699.1 hypothetical protein DXN04_15660 [Chitinophaga silvisoli]